MYSILRTLLFCLPAETSHNLALRSLKLLHKLHLSRLLRPTMLTQPVHILGLHFPNPVGLAAGLDKNADYLDALAALGFGFIEVGTVTPRPQAGNPKPRIFRIPQHQAIINRMGFNNKGIDYLIERIKHAHYKGILGINIGKNKDTPTEQAVNDYLECLRKAYPYASYITINISSPNTPGLRDFQKADSMHALLAPLLDERNRLHQQSRKYVPLLVKLAPDLDDTALDAIATVALTLRIDGLIISNTTLSRPGIEPCVHSQETGGLSGQPVRQLSTEILQKLSTKVGRDIILIGVGGIMNREDTTNKIQAGAQLVQIYSGFIYQGPALIQQAITAFQQSTVTNSHKTKY